MKIIFFSILFFSICNFSYAQKVSRGSKALDNLGACLNWRQSEFYFLLRPEDFGGHPNMPFEDAHKYIQAALDSGFAIQEKDSTIQPLIIIDTDWYQCGQTICFKKDGNKIYYSSIVFSFSNKTISIRETLNEHPDTLKAQILYQPFIDSEKKFWRKGFVIRNYWKCDADLVYLDNGKEWLDINRCVKYKPAH